MFTCISKARGSNTRSGCRRTLLQESIARLLTRPVGRPPNEVRCYYASFRYRAGSWTKPRRVVAKIEWHPGERVGFIVTNMARSAENVIAFYNKRGTCEQDQGRQGRDQMDAAVLPFLRGQRCPSPASCAGLQSRQFPALAGDARADQGLAALRASAENASTRQNCAAPLAFQASNQNNRLSVRSWCYIKAEWRCLGTEFTVGTGQTRRAGSSG
jgi:Transposase DDE domain group 1